MYKGRNTGSEKLSDSPKVTQQVAAERLRAHRHGIFKVPFLGGLYEDTLSLLPLIQPSVSVIQPSVSYPVYTSYTSYTAYTSRYPAKKEGLHWVPRGGLGHVDL